MNIITDSDFPLGSKTVISIGYFDGVHTGHRLLINKQIDRCNSLGEKSVVYTFSENPRNILNPGSVKYITGSSEKQEILDSLGVDWIYYEEFERVKDLFPEQFADLLCEKFNAECVICGYNFRFGRNRAGDAAMLAELMKSRGVETIVVPPLYYGNETVSSSAIRRCISQGDMERAAGMLGRSFSFSLPVEHGRRVGRAMGFPTINQAFPVYRAVPKFGVYAVVCRLQGSDYKGIANIGMRPTVDEEKYGPVSETHIFGYDGDLYGANVKIELISFIREERKFSDLNELALQIKNDIDNTIAFFEKSNDK